jgi:hypothetical protein
MMEGHLDRPFAQSKEEKKKKKRLSHKYVSLSLFCFILKFSLPSHFINLKRHHLLKFPPPHSVPLTRAEKFNSKSPKNSARESTGFLGLISS